jgi:ABC-type Fe3+/spermidine/putrescine transport system ATPase subunit
VNRPAVLLLDEPLAALDAQLRKSMQLELKRLQQEVGITFVYVTHDQEEALVMSDRIAVLNNGKVRQLGTPRSVYDSPESAFVAKFIGQSNLLPGAEIVGDSSVGAKVKLASGHVVPATTAGVPPGRRGSLMIRPEDMRLSGAPPQPDGGAALRGRVTQETYLGSSLRVEVEIDGVTMLGSLGKANSGQLGVGDDVWVSWQGSSARFLPDDQSGRADL